jgi:hypothetical protein
LKGIGTLNCALHIIGHLISHHSSVITSRQQKKKAPTCLGQSLKKLDEFE